MTLISDHENITIKGCTQGEFRMDAFNVFNHINAGNPSSSCIDCTISSNAGVNTGMAVGASPRQLEFSASIHF